MIKLTDIEFIDFGRHKHIKQQLEGNVIGLTGPNGKGKTTILQGVEFGITGSIDTDDNDPLGEWIRKGTSGGKGAKSAQVNLGFITDSGKKGKIERKINKTATSRELTLEGMTGGPFSADKKVQQIMLALLGVDKRALGSTVFIKQGAIDAMFGGKTDRRDFYTRLLMLGHLPKIADVIDGYRKNVASSVIDLSAVLDEAQNAESEATAEFSTIETQLRDATDYSELITLASRLVFLFGDQDSAHASVTGELATLGSDPAATIETIKKANKSRDLRVVAITASRLAHAQAQTARAESQRNLYEAETLRQQQDEYQTADAELKVKMASQDSAVNYAALTVELQRKVDAATIIESLDGNAQSLEFDVSLMAAQMEGATSMVNEAQVEYDKTLKTVDELSSDLSVRKNILAEIQGDHSHDAQCLVCGAPEAAMQEGYMTASMTELQRKLDDAKSLLENANRNLNSARNALRETSAAHAAGDKELANLQQRLKTALETIAGDTTDRSELHTRMEESRVKSNEQTILNNEIQRLQQAVSRLEIVTEGKPYQTDAKICELKSAVAAAAANAAAVWNTEIDVEQQTLLTEIEADNAEIAKLTEAQTRLQAAREWLDRTENELQDLCLTKAPNLPDDIYSRGMIMTAGVADSAVTKLRDRQSEYDRLRGAREAARTAMTAAQRRVIDTESKIEGQQQRLTLVERLTKLRDAFRPTGVSLEYLDYKFSQVAAMASDYLAESGADFTVVASESAPLSYDFIRMSPGEEWMGQSRLSGGQKVRLAVATLRAIHSLVVPNVGLLVLDEPTTHLDMEAKLALADMLRRIGNEGGLQILVCDHDPVLLDACSSVIEIPD